MGLFDYLRCDLPLPERGVSDRWFQTKDTPAQWTDRYAIHADGTLWHQAYDLEDRSDPQATGLARLRGMATPVNQRWEPCGDFTGEICFYDLIDGQLQCFSAYFVQGTLAHPIVALPTLPPPPADTLARSADLD